MDAISQILDAEEQFGEATKKPVEKPIYIPTKIKKHAEYVPKDISTNGDKLSSRHQKSSSSSSSRSHSSHNKSKDKDKDRQKERDKDKYKQSENKDRENSSLNKNKTSKDSSSSSHKSSSTTSKSSSSKHINSKSTSSRSHSSSSLKKKSTPSDKHSSTKSSSSRAEKRSSSHSSKISDKNHHSSNKSSSSRSNVPTASPATSFEDSEDEDAVLAQCRLIFDEFKTESSGQSTEIVLPVTLPDSTLNSAEDSLDKYDDASKKKRVAYEHAERSRPKHTAKPPVGKNHAQIAMEVILNNFLLFSIFKQNTDFLLIIVCYKTSRSCTQTI